MLSVIAICVGACLGALARWQLGLWLNPTSAEEGIFPWGTLAANLIGGYLIGLCMGVFQNMPQLDPEWRLLCITGFLGALTTFPPFLLKWLACFNKAACCWHWAQPACI